MAGKWTLHRIFSRIPSVRPHLPETSRLSRDAASGLLHKYGSVYIKPIRKHMGIGIVRAWRTRTGYRFVKIRGAVHRASGIDALLRRIAAHPAAYIVQRDVRLARRHARPFDIRVMMMRDGKGKWAYTGMLAKVAGAGSVITNVSRSGGYAVPVETALNPLFSREKVREIKAGLLRLSRTICAYSGRYKSTSEIGIDYGIDRSGKIWLIEINYDFPSHGLFNRLKDKTFYRLIKQTKREYLARRRRY